MYRIIISIGLAIMVFPGITQDATSFREINTETYRHFLSGEWDSVIFVGKMALKQDVDYYYLRLRMGIAFYNQKKYRQSEKHFKHALEFNNADPVTLEYLYFALLLSGQEDRASMVRKHFKGKLASKLPPEKGKFFDHLGADFLYEKGVNEDLLADPGGLFPTTGQGVQSLTRHFSNTSLSISNRVAPGFRINHAYTYLSKVSYQYYNDGLYLLNIQDQHVYQHQYYISPVITLGSGFSFAPMFHILGVHYQAPIQIRQGNMGGTSQVVMGYLDEQDYVSGVGISKNALTLELYLGAWYASLNNEEKFQNRLGLTWFPLGNLDLYAGAYLNSQYGESDSAGVISIIPELLFGVGIADKVWLDINLAIGDMSNYLEYNGSIVYNSYSDVMQKKLILKISVPVTQNGSLLYLGGRWTAHQSSFHPFDTAPGENLNNIYYNAISIYGGISWKF